jgi:CRISPR-associated protein Cmr4
MSILKLYAISPIHAGSGSSVATVDLPIQRERHTNYPNIQASTLKGGMRAHFREFIGRDKKIYKKDEGDNANIEFINFIFGSDEQDGWNKQDDSISGAISISDAKLFAFPMRSNVAPFIWVTCHTIIDRLRRDLELTGISSIEEQSNNFNENAVNLKGSFEKDVKIILEDVAVTVDSESSVKIAFIENNFAELDNLLLISDEMFDYCVSNCTEIQTNIKINSKTGTAQDGALRYQEFLPSDTLLYSVVNFHNQMSREDLKAEIIKDHVQGIIKDFIQIGGDATLGKGICKIDWINNK